MVRTCWTATSRVVVRSRTRMRPTAIDWIERIALAIATVLGSPGSSGHPAPS